MTGDYGSWPIILTTFGSGAVCGICLGLWYARRYYFAAIDANRALQRSVGKLIKQLEENE